MIFLDIETQNDWTSGEHFTNKEMKISYVGVIDSSTGEKLDFWESDMEKLGKLLEKAEIVVHYNGFTFDMPIIANYIGDEVLKVPQLDLMVAAHKAIGFRPKLDDLTNATLGYGKIGEGADAVKYWVSGDLDSLKKYCLQDVQVTMDLYHFGLEHGYIKYYNKNGFLTEVEIDWKLGERITEETSDDVITLF